MTVFKPKYTKMSLRLWELKFLPFKLEVQSNTNSICLSGSSHEIHMLDLELLKACSYSWDKLSSLPIF